ncbi:MAG: alcohol dehydrogenase catalytic domain-containing protein [Planctomycetes bacterium]|nr:alcohol dehydrogenase catalytic domain-containing protein [Planctomycetota bacterium]
MSKTNGLPQTQYAVQLVGPGELTLNRSKSVFRPGPTQVVGRIEAVGLCFSDLKLLKQFSTHARKTDILVGLTAAELATIPSYVPGDRPTVPGHEAVCRIVAVGEKVTRCKVGDRRLIQTDYRALKTANSNGSFGYNFEGALQEYVLMDERVTVDAASGESYLLAAEEGLSASAVALVEPWACVECAYVTEERRTIKAGGRLAIVVEPGHKVRPVERAYSPDGPPAEVVSAAPDQVGALPDGSFDDIVYFGAAAATVEALCDKLAARGIINLVTGGKTFGQPVSIDIGRIHYGMTRWTGTTGDDPADGYALIPRDGEVRDGDSILVVGAGGPMGQMHVIRDLCTDATGLTLTGTDFDNARLESLGVKARPLAEANGVDLRLVNPRETPLGGTFSYIALMAPVPQLVAAAVLDSAERCLINIFAGIPAGTRQAIDLDTYVRNRCWMFGTSGSRISDMKLVLDKVTAGKLDTNVSVDAVSGMAGAIEGIAAVENRTLAGKILVYPALRDVGLIPLTDLADRYPAVAAALRNGTWNKDAEAKLLEVAGG